jgi:phosphoglycolate phosphatase
MKQKYSHIIWDWNGTLFDDVAWCVECMNTMLMKRKLPVIHDISTYHSVFCFPVAQYYRNVGFDFHQEPFEDLAKEYIDLYHSNKSGNCKLYTNAEKVLATIKNRRLTQCILSASEMSNLHSQMSEFDIEDYFDEILGLPDIHAKSKIDIGFDYMSRKKIKDALLIGDTVHDYEVATALGIDCVIIPNGHQSREKLLLYEIPIIEDISHVIAYIDGTAV